MPGPRCALVPLAVAIVAAALASSAAAEPEAVLDARLGARLSVPLGELADQAWLADGQGLRVVEVGRDLHTSHHVVAIRDAETPHRHDRHDLLVVLIRGHGTLRLGDEVRPVGEGSILYVPRGTVHAFANAGPEPAVGYVVYAPAFDGDDRVEVAGE